MGERQELLNRIIAELMLLSGIVVLASLFFCYLNTRSGPTVILDYSGCSLLLHPTPIMNPGWLLPVSAIIIGAMIITGSILLFFEVKSGAFISIASGVLAIFITGLSIIVFFPAAVPFLHLKPFWEDSCESLGPGLGFIVFIIASLFGLVLGIIFLAKAKRNRKALEEYPIEQVQLS